MSRRKINPADSAAVSNELITISDQIMHGTPCFTGTRVPVKTLFDYLQAGDPLDRFLDHFPTVDRAQAVRVLARIGEEIDASTDGTINLT